MPCRAEDGGATRREASYPTSVVNPSGKPCCNGVDDLPVCVRHPSDQRDEPDVEQNREKAHRQGSIQSQGDCRHGTGCHHDDRDQSATFVRDRQELVGKDSVEHCNDYVSADAGKRSAPQTQSRYEGQGKDDIRGGTRAR